MGDERTLLSLPLTVGSDRRRVEMGTIERRLLMASQLAPLPPLRSMGLDREPPPLSDAREAVALANDNAYALGAAVGVTVIPFAHVGADCRRRWFSFVSRR